MSHHAVVHTPVGGPINTRAFRILLSIALLGGLVGLWRFIAGIGAVTNLSDGYPWGVWIAIDVVVGTALGCGGFAIAILVYILNKGEYHPLVRPALLTSLLGYGLAIIAVTIDLGRYWGLWKVTVFFWRWTHSPQLEVALCVAAYNLVLVIELAPALFEKWRDGKNPGLKRWAERGLSILDRSMIWILALGILLPTMHQSTLGTMMLLPGPRMHPLWLTPWLPFLFLVNCIMIGYAVVTLEASFSAKAFGRKRETTMLASLAKVVTWVALFWVVFRIAEVALTGKLPFVNGLGGLAFVGEIVVLLLGAGILMSAQRRAQASWQARAAILFLVGGSLFRVNTYLVAFSPGANWSYFPSVPELLITFGIIATELLVYLVIVKIFPILGGAPAPARG